MKLKIKKLYDQAILPSYAHEGDAGMDLFSAHDYVLAPGDRTLVETGISVEVPEGYELQIRPRSGLALKHGLSIVNSPGTIDSGYRGQVGVILINHGQEVYEVRTGDKIAQGVMSKIERVVIEEVEELSDTSRGTGGFGSTGE
ncbi:dUTP diphosphatase [Candidatus Pacearchaeota archaeon]|nr:dUTP diphosphatase [Candidatus Pacearchaeota archaeon]